VTAEEVRAAQRTVRMPATRWIAGGMGAVVVAAVCMRPALTAVGPVLGLIGTDTGLSHTMLGLLSALPLLAFAAVSPIVHGPVRRIGIERTVAWALAGLAAGSAFRAVPGPAPALGRDRGRRRRASRSATCSSRWSSGATTGCGCR
jgi:cyanate permease